MRDWLKNARTAKKMTMKDLAAKLHISESYYCSIENGQRQKNLELSLAEEISNILEIPLSEILRGEKTAAVKERGDELSHARL